MKRVIERLRLLEKYREEVTELDEAISQLSPAQQVILRLLVVGGERQKSLDKVAQILDVSVSTVTRWRRDALNTLKSLLYPEKK